MCTHFETASQCFSNLLPNQPNEFPPFINQKIVTLSAVQTPYLHPRSPWFPSRESLSSLSLRPRSPNSRSFRVVQKMTAPTYRLTFRRLPKNSRKIKQLKASGSFCRKKSFGTSVVQYSRENGWAITRPGLRLRLFARLVGGTSDGHNTISIDFWLQIIPSNVNENRFERWFIIDLLEVRCYKRFNCGYCVHTWFTFFCIINIIHNIFVQ